MRNRFPGICYRCGQNVAVGDGHFERFGRLWRTQHASCAIAYRGQPDPGRQAMQFALLVQRAKMTGKRGQRARQELNRRNAEINLEDF